MIQQNPEHRATLCHLGLLLVAQRRLEQAQTSLDLVRPRSPAEDNDKVTVTKAFEELETRLAAYDISPAKTTPALPS